jgi:poly-gamma-glutamate synthesis protein (capsule biosynthesis protein)
LPDEAYLSFGKKLKTAAVKDSILIVSSDFSHNATPEQAQKNDTESIKVLADASQNKFDKVTSDCKQCMLALSGFLGNKPGDFHLLDNENSFDISGQDQNSVTSYVSGYYAKEDYIKIMFVGDLMFDRGIRYYAEKNNSNDFIFDKIRPELASNDLVVANLEGPITDNKSISSGTAPGSTNNYFFTFDPSLAKTLFHQNIRLVSLGNNHILNFGTQGLKTTQKYLSQSNVEYFGAPDGKISVVKDINGIKVGFVSYNQFTGDLETEQKATISEIKKIKTQADITVVFSHWGNEYQLTATEYNKNLAHQFIDAGADLIIGSHPHVIEDPKGAPETYNGKRIYYSLGNFIFDQYFSEDVRNGMGVVVKINKQTKKLNFEEKKLYLQDNGQTILKQ